MISRRLSRVAAAGLVLGLSASLAQAQRVQVGASETRSRANTRADSLVMLIFNSDVKEVKRIVEEWQERELKLLKELRALASDDFPARRRLEDELRLHARDGIAMMSAVETRCVGGAGPRPQGYLGLNTEASGQREGTQIRDAVVVVKSVEAGSPAQRAGLRRDDQVLSIGGVPPLGSGVGQLLVPGRSLVVRYVREGQLRESTVVVAPRPDGFGDSCGEIERILEPMNMPAPGILFLEGPQRRVVITESVRPEQPQSSEISVMVFAPTSEDTRASRFFGGAEFRMLTEDWRETLGVKQGVLVNEVAPGSAASQAGLRAGDVITMVGKTPVTSPGAFVQLVATSESPDVQLTLMRKKDKKTLTLRLTQR
ncbi:MAG: PDZ domain-containing protein [Gemmatimonadaceae bacterium]|nr:PDZ domain-containing protein [Gemmatimonadaceae bacterium]